MYFPKAHFKKEISIKENKLDKSEHRLPIHWPPNGFITETAILGKASLKSKAWRQKI